MFDILILGGVEWVMHLRCMSGNERMHLKSFEVGRRGW